MDLTGSRRGMASEVLKLAAALLVAFGVFAMLVAFAAGPQGADETVFQMGGDLLNGTQKDALRIINST